MFYLLIDMIDLWLRKRLRTVGLQGVVSNKLMTLAIPLSCCRVNNKKRDWKNKKFGFGGQKKRSKSNSKESSNDARDFSVAKNSKGPAKRSAKVRLLSYHVS